MFCWAVCWLIANGIPPLNRPFSFWAGSSLANAWLSIIRKASSSEVSWVPIGIVWSNPDLTRLLSFWTVKPSFPIILANWSHRFFSWFGLSPYTKKVVIKWNTASVWLMTPFNRFSILWALFRLSRVWNCMPLSLWYIKFPSIMVFIRVKSRFAIWFSWGWISREISTQPKEITFRRTSMPSCRG